MSLKQENLVQTNVQYKVGQRLVKVGNTFMPVGFGGNFEPGAASGGTAMKFYKCASVDTENKTWSGYEAYQDAIGIWTFSDTEMSLTYGDYFTPVVGKVYDATASIVISTLFDGMITQNTVFLLNKSLADSSENNIQVVNKGLTVSNTGIMCTENGYAQIPANALPDSVLCDNKDWTIEIKFRSKSPELSKVSALFGNGHYDAGMPAASRFDMLCSPGKISVGGFNEMLIHYELRDTDWHIWKITHTKDNLFSSSFEGETYSESRTGFNLRAYNVYIGYDGGDRNGYPFEIEYIRISNVIE